VQATAFARAGDVVRIASGVPEAAAQSIIEAFRKVRFHPGEIGGIPVKSQVRIEVTLEQASS
jgi:hypothetical protein